MADHVCCSGSQESRNSCTRPLMEIGKWAAPGAAFLLIPKCPLCIVGCVATFTGIGLSFSAAQYISSTLIAASLAGAAYLIVRAILARRW